jgi:hypothetical protein
VGLNPCILEKSKNMKSLKRRTVDIEVPIVRVYVSDEVQGAGASFKVNLPYPLFNVLVLIIAQKLHFDMVIYAFCYVIVVEKMKVEYPYML